MKYGAGQKYEVRKVIYIRFKGPGRFQQKKVI